MVTHWLVYVSFISVTEVLVTQWLVHVSFISVTEVLVTQWLVHVSIISATEVLVTQWLVHVSFISVTEVLVTQWSVHVSFLPDISFLDTVISSGSCVCFAVTGFQYKNLVTVNKTVNFLFYSVRQNVAKGYKCETCSVV